MGFWEVIKKTTGCSGLMRARYILNIEPHSSLQSRPNPSFLSESIAWQMLTIFELSSKTHAARTKISINKECG